MWETTGERAIGKLLAGLLPLRGLRRARRFRTQVSAVLRSWVARRNRNARNAIQRSNLKSKERRISDDVGVAASSQIAGDAMNSLVVSPSVSPTLFVIGRGG